MEPQHIPDIEIISAVKWIFILMLGSGLATVAGLIAKRLYYGKEKYDRRNDTGNNRGWIERFLSTQERYTDAVIGIEKELTAIHSILTANGEELTALRETFLQCEHHPPQKHR